jgi:hypothetical protein
MSAQDLQERSRAEIEQALDHEPADRRIVHCEADEQWSAELLRRVSEHNLTVLARSADLVVFFDADGREIGWRDEGRTGATGPRWIGRDVFLQIVMAELELPPDVRLGNLTPRELPPLGWTHEGVLFLKPAPSAADVLRVWVDPVGLRVIQCLAGPPPAPEPRDEYRGPGAEDTT